MKAGTKLLTRVLSLLIVAGVLFVVQAPVAHAAPPPPDVGLAIMDPTAVPPPVNRSNPTTVTIDLVAKEVIAELAPGKKAWLWTFNGTVPGPMIRVMEGDTLVINLKNELIGNLEPHNVDFHAAMGPGGGAAVTNVEPGETKTLRFKALRAGAYIYHCAGEGMPWEHVAYGMYGLIMVEPQGGLPKVDREFYIGQSDWYVKPNDERAFLAPDVLILDEAKASAEHPDYFTFNGHTKALTEKMPLMANQGDKVRFFFVTGGPNIASNWHIIGTIFDKVYTGHPKKFMENEETVVVPPGSAAVFELATPVPGQYLLVDHALWRVPKGAAGILQVMPTVPPSDSDPTGSWPTDIFYPPAFGPSH